MADTKRRLGMVMDPIEGITPAKDSTLAMLLAAQRRDWELIYLRQQDLLIREGVPIGHGRRITVFDDADHWFELGDAWEDDLDALDTIFMRKDPPFDMEYIYTTYILQLAEDRGSLVVNEPRSLRDINEKAYTAWFAHCTPPNLITRSVDEVKKFLAEQKKIVLKPLDGMGGRSIFVVNDGDPNTNVILETLTDYGTKYTVAQRYVPEITAGDKRILLIDGEPVEYALARIPGAEDPRGNLVMGAKGEGRELTERDRWLCAEIGPVLRDKGVIFAGIDVIGDYLTEINVTSPTGIRELDRQFGIDIADRLLTAVERRLSG